MLDGYTPKPEDFVDQFVELQGGDRIVVPKPPGLNLMVHMLNDTPTLRMVCETSYILQIIVMIKWANKWVIFLISKFLAQDNDFPAF